RFSQPRIGAPDGFFVVTFPMSPTTLFDWHVHEDHQLAWASAGVLRDAKRVHRRLPQGNRRNPRRLLRPRLKTPSALGRRDPQLAATPGTRRVFRDHIDQG